MPQNERNWGMACHLAALSGYIIPLGWVLGPLIVWLLKRDEYPFVHYNGKEAINFQISMLIYAVISAVLVLLLIGIVLLLIIVILHIVCTIVAAIKASNGEYFRYPLTIRFVR